MSAADCVAVLEMLPCPFCGREPTLTLEGVAGDGITEPFHVRCLRCDIAMTRPRREVVIAAWNRRALRQEGEPVAWWKFNSDGKRIAITDDELAAQPDWIKKKWASAHPLYATPSPKGPTTP